MSRVLIVKNASREGPGLLRDVLQEHRVGADVVELDRGDGIPPLDDYAALIVLGGPASANDETEPMRLQVRRVSEALESGLPYLGICLGHQVLARAAGATIAKNPVKEIGFVDPHGAPYTVSLTDGGRHDALFDGVPERFRVFQLHGDAVQPGRGVEILATGSACEVQAIRAGRRAYGLQMHVELVPEMLAVWAAQDPDLRDSDVAAMQSTLASINAEYAGVGRRLFANFLAIAGLTNAVDLSREERVRAV